MDGRWRPSRCRRDLHRRRSEPRRPGTAEHEATGSVGNRSGAQKNIRVGKVNGTVRDESEQGAARCQRTKPARQGSGTGAQEIRGQNKEARRGGSTMKTGNEGERVIYPVA